MVAELDRYVAPLLELQVFSGTVAVAKGERIILERSYGFADAEHDIPIRASTVFRIASISKPFTRALIGRLSDLKLLALDDPVSKWLPDFPSANIITIRMLLDHRGGVPHINSLPYDEEALEPNSLGRLVDSIAKRPLEFEPGANRRYSNGGYAVLARIVELVAREPFGTVIEREILEPLALTATRHEADGLIVRGLARGYMPSPEIMNRLVKAPFQEMDTKQGGGSMVSSVADLITWARAIGRSEILAESTWAELFPAKDGVFEFQGRSPGFNAYIVHDRRRDMTTVVLANNYSASMIDELAAAAAAIADGRPPQPLAVVAPVSDSEAQQVRMAGRYSVPDGVLPLPPGSGVELRMMTGSIVVFIGAAPIDVLVAQGRGRYLARALWSMIETEPGRAVNSLRVRALYRDSEFTATRVQ